MEYLQLIMAGLTAVILFVFGLEHFSNEIERISGERFRRFIGSATRNPVMGVIIGAITTGLIQSSSATSVISISLVNAGVLSFRNSVGVIFGSNIGTTVTAQLVAFKLTAFAPVFVILGFILSLIPSRYSVFGKAVFYFGFVFFSLNLISSSLAPLQSNELLVSFLTQPGNPMLAILFGCLFTAIVQSSSVTTGLTIIFVQQGVLSLENAVPLIMGANIGTTATALIAVFQMDVSAKKTALCHFLFNIGGVLLFAPLLLLFGDRLDAMPIDPAIMLAMVHLLFNLGATVLFLLFINPFIRFIDFLLGDGQMDFERLPLPGFDQSLTFQVIQEDLGKNLDKLFRFIQENYKLVTLSIEANYKGIFEAAEKRLAYLSYAKRDLLSYFSKVVGIVNDEQEVRELLRLINLYDYLFQVHDSITDIFDTKRTLDENYIELNSDVLLLVREISTETLGFFDDLGRARRGEELSIRKRSRDFQEHLDEVNKELLKLMAIPNRKDAGGLTNFVTYSQRLKDKLVNFMEVSSRNSVGS